MSTTIEQQVVEMRFDNRNFEQNVSSSMSTLDKFKQKLNLSGAAKGLENVGSAAKGVNLSPLCVAAETVGLKFNAMYTIADQALRNITNSAVNAGKRIVSALTIEPVKTGLSEYETQINAVQTILANTESKGTTLGQVNSALDQLNTYADKTIYNFTEMTRNIGTFTAAGVDLKTSVSAIQGIANLAAVSGSSSQQASTAMYQLSQALAAGRVSLMDWNSVVNAGMGGQVFQDALKRTAEAMGTNVDAIIEKYGSFRESLTQGEWLTADVLTKTLEQFTMAAEEGSKQWDAYKKSLMDDGYTSAQAEEILKMANTATDAATKVKTATQLWDTLKETAQSGWTQTWEIILGDFGEAKHLFSSIYETLSPMIDGMSKARNDLLSAGLSSGWKQLLGQGIADEEGYRDSIKSVAKEHGVAIDDMIKAEQKLDSSLSDTDAFQKVLKKGLADGSITSDMLTESVTKLADKMRNMTDAEREAAGYTEEHIAQIEELEKGLKDGSISMEEFTKKMMRSSGRENLIQSLLNTFNGLMSIITPIKSAFSEIFPAMTGEQLYQFTERVRAFTENLTLSSEVAEKVKRTFKGVFSIFDIGKKIVTSIGKAFLDLAKSDGVSTFATFILDTFASLGDFFTSLNKSFDTGGLSGMLSSLVSGISSFLGGATGHIESFVDILSVVGDVISNVISKIWGGLKVAFQWISDTFSVGDIFAGLAGGGIFVAAKKLSGFLDKIVDTIKNMFGGDKEGGLKDIIGKFGDVLDSVGDSLNAFSMGVKISSLVSIAVAVGILSASLKTISNLEVGNIVKSLIAIGAMMAMLSLTMGSITKTLSKYDSKGIAKAGFSLILIATAINILASAMEKISKLSLQDLAKGLIGVGGGLVELAVGLKIIGKTKISLSTSIAMLALAESCKILGDALQKFATLSWDEIKHGLTGMGGALGEMVIALGALSKVGGFGSMLGGIGIFIAVQALSDMADSLKKFGNMQWDEIKRGLTGMGGALAEVGIVVGMLGKIAGFSSIFASGATVAVTQGLDDLAEISVVTGSLGKLAGFSSLFASGAIVIVIQGLSDLAEALKSFGAMSWDEVKIGLTGMGGALAEVGIVTGSLGKLAGFSGLIGSGSILIVVQGLGDLAEAFRKFGGMSWEEVKIGLVGMGRALSEVAIISGTLGGLAGLPALLGSGSLLLGIQGLGDLADALKKFGEMSWDEIKQGLAAMGGALSEVALGGLLNTLSGIGAMAISEVAGSLGTLADSVKKWAGVTLPENLGSQLGTLASGVKKFTWAEMGAGALAEAAPAVGIMADSVRKWTGVTIPEGLTEKLSKLADGVKKFTWAEMGAGALADAAPAIGILADGVKKWSGVTVPENIEADMTSLANGVGAFSFAFMGGWSMSALVTPLGELPASIQKWANVTVPEGLETNLKSLANGIKAFSFAFAGGWSMEAVIGPLGDLSGSIQKWAGVTVPEGLGSNLSSLAEGIRPFGTIGDISQSISGIGTLASSIKSLTEIDFKGISSNLSGLANSINSLKFDKSISASLKDVIDSIIKVASTSGKLSSVGSDIMTSIVNGIRSGQPRLTATVNSAINAISKAFASKTGTFNKAGVSLMNALTAGMRSRSQSVSTAVIVAVSAAVSAAGSYYNSFYNAGVWLGQGLVAGINSMQAAAYAAGFALGQAAVQGEKDGQNSASPSKETIKAGKWLGEGLVIGMKRMGGSVYKAGTSMGKSAVKSISNSIRKVSDFVESGIDTQPTIRPVVDLSNVRAGVNSIGNMLDLNPSVGVSANVGHITAMMNRRSQNGVNDDVVSAINKLHDRLNNLGNTTYTINGITYDDGSQVSEAIQTIARAIKMDRRV